MEPSTQPASGYYVWEVPGAAVSIHLHLNVVDRLLAEVMRGFGAVPKRGIEVGGVLLGTVIGPDPEASTSIVRIDDYEPVACSHSQGPSYLLDAREFDAFAEACERWSPDGSRTGFSGTNYAVGYFRSHTREGLSLSSDDLALLDGLLPSPSQIGLLIKPHASTASLGGFFVREGGKFPEVTPQEFPFRRRDLGGEPELISRPNRDRPPRELDPLPSRTPRARSWIWIPLSFVFLLGGLLLGYLGARTADAGPDQNGSEVFSLGLAVLRADSNLNLKWNREAPAIRAAQRGVLEIEDGSSKRLVDLDIAQLHNGSFIYGSATDSVRFRLIVYPTAQLSVTESMEWKK